MGQKIKQTEIKEVIRSVVRDNIKEVTTNDWHYKAIMAIWDKGGSFTRKKIGTILLKDPQANRRDIENALRTSDYDEITDVTDRLRIEGVIKEVEDKIPGGLAKGMTLNDIAEKHGVGVDMLVAEFKKGIQTEMEHTTDREMAKEITLDHLFEDPNYYTKLSSIEEYIDDKGVERVAAALPQTEEEPVKEGDESSSEETLKGLNEMAMGNLERIEDYAEMIADRMKEGQTLDSWMYSQITLALDNLNAVHDAMDGTDGIKESVNEASYNVKADNAYQFINGATAVLGVYLRDEKLESGVKNTLQRVVKDLEGLRKYFFSRKDELVNELSYNEKRIRDGNPNDVFYAFYKGQFAAIYSAMGPRGLFDMYWDKFKVRRPAGSQFKLNPEFIFISKKDYDSSISNRYAKLKPHIDKLSDKLQNESVNEGAEADIITQIKTIAKNHQHDVIVDPKSGKKMKVDAFSASAIATVYDSLSGSNKEKFVSSGLLAMQQMAMKLLKK